jgi:hypothetical protein
MTDASDSGADAPGLERGWQRARTILDEFVDAARTAALSIAEDERRRAADQVAGFAGAARAAAHALESGNTARSARCAARTADTIDRFADAVRHRRWSQILSDTESFARREPRLFMLGAAALGYVAGRMLVSSTETEAVRSARSAIALQTETVAAAVSSGAGNGELVEKTGTITAEREVP